MQEAGVIFRSVYDAMAKDETDKNYLSDIVMAAFEVMKSEQFTVAMKNSSESEFYREEGNRAYRKGQLQVALVNYNKALAYAPSGSLSLKLAYSNRSAVLFSAKQYKASERDCVTALAIDCPTSKHVKEKLEKRKSRTHSENMNCNVQHQKDKVIFRNYAEDYFKLKSQNKDIPCASNDVDVIFESGVPKVIARRDIPAGTLVALEKAFVTFAPLPDRFISCHHCRKLDLNLFPCSGCVATLFCSKQCEETCLAEYHTIECQLAASIVGLDPIIASSLRAVIKLRNMCGSWEEFITVSYEYGQNKFSSGTTVNDIFDSNKLLSILSFNTDRHIVHGALFNCSVLCAALLTIFQRMKSFLPQNSERKLAAMKAMARIIMYLCVYVPTTHLPLPTKLVSHDLICLHIHAHRGLFPFAGKLKHSCMPNLQRLAVNNSLALVALEQIKAGTELTMSHVFYLFENMVTKDFRRMEMFINCRTFCTCVVCSSSPEQNLKPAELSMAQKKIIKQCISLNDCRVFGFPIRKCFDQIYKALECLKDNRMSKDYAEIYNMLKELYLYLVHNKLYNVTISKEY